ncbi:MAG: hypothetical protein PHU14_08120 [Methylovulum sp.]|nr:hypothetical protein [Methylovulum sp.]
MTPQRHPLITTVLVMGVLVALLSYLFHPDVGVLKLVVNGQPVDNAVIRFAALPSALIVLLISAIVAVLLFFGVGLVIFLTVLFVALLGVFLIVPFFWPLLVVIFLLFALLSPPSSR